MPHDAVILIGPMSAGKTTIRKLLAEQLGASQCEMDDLRWGYYKEIGYNDQEIQKQRDPNDGVWGIYRLWKPFEIHALERILADHPAGVISLGGGHSVYEDEGFLARAKEALSSFPNVVLILPSADAEESLGILRERMADAPQDIIDLNTHFVRHRSNRELAKHIVYTKGKTPDETCQELITALGLKKEPES